MAISADNLFARDGFWWWVGVVEDRMDPLKLGRVKIRITGYHTDNKSELPTQDLPWAMPMQPIFSAAIAGKGQSPLGPLEGTWCVGFFADGAECQQPIVMGTLGGINDTSNACMAQAQAEQNLINSQRDTNGNVVLNPVGVALPDNPQPVQPDETTSNSIYLTLPPLSQDDVQKYMDAIGFRESSSIPGTVADDSIVSVVSSGKGYTIVVDAAGAVVKRTGVKSWRNNNPGNITSDSGFAKRYGAVGVDNSGGIDSQGTQVPNLAVFPTLAAGEAAKRALLFTSTSEYMKKDVWYAIERYAGDPRGHTIDISAYARYVASKAGVSVSSTMTSLTETQQTAMMNAITSFEGFKVGKITVVTPAKNATTSSAGVQNYSTVNQIGYIGKYQLGAQALQTIGYLKWPVPSRSLTNQEMNDPKIWTGKNGANSIQDFLQNKNNVQEIAMFEHTKSNYVILKGKSVIDTAMAKQEVAGYLGAAHLLGWTGARNLRDGKNGADANGAQAKEYYNIGYNAVSGKSAIPVAGATSLAKSNANVLKGVKSWAGALNNPKIGQPDAFGDPNSVFPTCEYAARADTNKLSSNNDSLDTTIVAKKDKDKVEDIPTANGASSGKWAEPPPAYNAKYPYNHVKETESGHIMEWDDTPGAERIHLYHRTGTYVEIDRDGSVRYKVKGENYEIYNRNSKTYVMGNLDITVDGAQTLLVKNAVDVEILGKTTINIKNDADVNVAGTFNLKAQNINIEALQDLNITTGNYFSNKIGGDLNYFTYGDENHRVFGEYDLDAITVNINSGSSTPILPAIPGYDDAPLSDLYGNPIDGFQATGLKTLMSDIANVFTPIGKGFSNIMGKLGGLNGLNINNINLNKLGIDLKSLTNGLNLNNLASGLNLNSLTAGLTLDKLAANLNLNNLGINLNNIAGGVLSANVLKNMSGLSPATLLNAVKGGDLSKLGGMIGGAALINAVKNGDLNNLGKLVGVANADKLLGDFKLGNLNLDKLSQMVGASSILSQTQSGIVDSLKKGGLIPTDLLNRGEDVIKAFNTNGAGLFDKALPKQLLASVGVTNEFKNWTDFPPVAQLSKNFNLGDLTTKVQEVGMQFPIMKQAGLTNDVIATNLKALAVNALDPIKDKFSNMKISNAFKPVASYLISTEPNNPIAKLVDEIKTNVSGDIAEQVERQLESADEFNTGEAASIHLAGADSADYFAAAQWIRDNVPFDQLRLEYSTIGNTEPWITVVHKQEGNRSIDAVDKVVTTMNGQIVANYLADLSTV